MKTKLKRFGIAIPQDLLIKFDKYIKNKNYKNRSEAIRDLIRSEFVKETWISNKEVVGVISIVYDHHKRQLVDEIVDVQHNYQNLIISSSHIHLDHHHCLEVIIVRGKASLINKLKDNLASMKGVQHTTLSVTSTI